MKKEYWKRLAKKRDKQVYEYAREIVRIEVERDKLQSNLTSVLNHVKQLEERLND